jgi:hypothetical protein
LFCLVHKYPPLKGSTVHAFPRCVFRNEIFVLLSCYAAQIGGSYRRCGITCRAHIQGSSSARRMPGTLGCAVIQRMVLGTSSDRAVRASTLACAVAGSTGQRQCLRQAMTAFCHICTRNLLFRKHYPFVLVNCSATRIIKDFTNFTRISTIGG